MTGSFLFAAAILIAGMLWVHADRQLDRALQAAFNP